MGNFIYKIISDTGVEYLQENRGLLVTVFVLLILCIYFVCKFIREKQDYSINRYVLQVQRILTDAYRRPVNKEKALAVSAGMIRAESICFLDIEQGEIVDKYQWSQEGKRENYSLSEDEWEKMLSEFLDTLDENLSGVYRTSNLRKTDKVWLADLCESRRIENLVYVVITDSENSPIGIMLAMNVDKYHISIRRLNELAICFSIAVKNLKDIWQIERRGRYDFLTGLLNRNSYQEASNRYIKKKLKNFACIYVDANGLHTINNRNGHRAGDKMLRSIAKQLQIQFGAEDTYRIGGDEFVALCEGRTLEDVLKKIENFDEEIKRRNYSVSIGMDWCEADGDITEMIKNAEAKMYDEKYKHYLKSDLVFKNEIAGRNIDFSLISKRDCDTILTAISHIYSGIYVVDLNTDELRAFCLSEYLSKFFEETEQLFRKALEKYISDAVSSENRRQLEILLDYRNLEKQLTGDSILTMCYKKVNGEAVRLSIYRSPHYTEKNKETVWLFENVRDC